MLLDLNPVEVLGLQIAGIPDPSAGNHSPQSVSTTELNQIAVQINELFRDQNHGIDIFAVHNYRIAGQIEPGIFPVIVFGHNHLQTLNQVEGTVYVNAGTTGAAGIRGIQSSQNIPFSLSLLHFVYDHDLDDYVLAAVDSIQVQTLLQSFSLGRTFISYPGIRLADDGVGGFRKKKSLVIGLPAAFLFFIRSKGEQRFLIIVKWE